MMKCKLFLAMLLLVSAGLFAQNVSLDQAVQTSVQAIETRLPKEAKTAVLTFTSASQAFSDYIIDEIAAALSASRNIQVIDRQHTDAIRREFKEPLINLTLISGSLIQFLQGAKYERNTV